MPKALPPECHRHPSHIGKKMFQPHGTKLPISWQKSHHWENCPGPWPKIGPPTAHGQQCGSNGAQGSPKAGTHLTRRCPPWGKMAQMHLQVAMSKISPNPRTFLISKKEMPCGGHQLIHSLSMMLSTAHLPTKNTATSVSKVTLWTALFTTLSKFCHLNVNPTYIHWPS